MYSRASRYKYQNGFSSSGTAVVTTTQTMKIVPVLGLPPTDKGSFQEIADRAISMPLDRICDNHSSHGSSQRSMDAVESMMSGIVEIPNNTRDCTAIADMFKVVVQNSTRPENRKFFIDVIDDIMGEPMGRPYIASSRSTSLQPVDDRHADTIRIVLDTEALPDLEAGLIVILTHPAHANDYSSTANRFRCVLVEGPRPRYLLCEHEGQIATYGDIYKAVNDGYECSIVVKIEKL